MNAFFNINGIDANLLTHQQAYGEKTHPAVTVTLIGQNNSEEDLWTVCEAVAELNDSAIVKVDKDEFDRYFAVMVRGL